MLALACLLCYNQSQVDNRENRNVFRFAQDTPCAFIAVAESLNNCFFSPIQYSVLGILEEKKFHRRARLLKRSNGCFDTTINRDDYKLKLLEVVSQSAMSRLYCKPSTETIKLALSDMLK